MTTISGVPALQPLTRELTFVDQGLLGFESLLRYELSVYDPQTPFYWLRAQDEADVAFLVMEPSLLLDDYAFDLSAEDAERLEIHTTEDALVLVLLSVPEDPLAMTANLLGPLIFHRESGLGRQLVLERQAYPVRYPVFETAAS
ncbi:MAG: flagellar assembly protein FliW [Candidatus Sericytochromatia bacterium]